MEDAEAVHNDAFPEQITTKTQSCFYAIENLLDSKKTYTDLTGRFPHQSSRGKNYVCIAYNYDGNAILAEPIANREAATIISAW